MDVQTSKFTYDGPVEAPIKKDQVLARLKIFYDQELIGEYDLLASEEVKKVNVFSTNSGNLSFIFSIIGSCVYSGFSLYLLDSSLRPPLRLLPVLRTGGLQI